MLYKRPDDVTDWRDWENFCRIVETGSFTAAGDRAGIPKSSVSSSLARLEARLGSRLLDRTTRKVRVTEFGEVLYARVAPLFSQLREVESAARSSQHEVSGTLRIAAPYETGWLHLAPALASVLKDYPELRVEIDDIRDLPDLLEKRYDIAFIKTDARLPDSSLISKRVVAMDRAFYASPALVTKLGLARQPSDLDSWPAIVDAEDQQWDVFDNGREVARIRVRPSIRAPNAEIRVRSAIEGLGVVRLPPSFVADYMRRGELVRLLPSMLSSPVKVYAMTPARKLMPPKVRALLTAFDELRMDGMTDAERLGYAG
ncbi:LysR family transcriptional regulator [Cupriavidus sp. CuC1]|uniref:LysR family transcriptional regulator n=1 Tax=Cupriavidus sp. CuC1 TaxID=3373131 RepID=UPI0037D53BE1